MCIYSIYLQLCDDRYRLLSKQTWILAENVPCFGDFPIFRPLFCSGISQP